MQIDIVYDASVANAPAGFQAAVQAAVQLLEAAFNAPIEISIDVGWGEVGGKPLPAGAVAASTASEIGLGYNAIRNALWRDALTPNALAAAKALPAKDPTSGGTFLMSTAEAKALGLLLPTGGGSDGAIGLDSTTNFSFDPNNRAQPGLVDAIGVIVHEITEVLGRQSLLGLQPGDGSTLFGPLDLFRYSSPGVLAPTALTASFSIDGHNLLMPFDNPSNGGDSGDWSQTVTGDAFDAFADVAKAELMSAADLTLMDVLGYHPAIAAPATPTPSGPASPFQKITANASLAAGSAVHFVDQEFDSTDAGYTLDSSANTVPNFFITFTNNGTISFIGQNALFASAVQTSDAVGTSYAVVDNAASGKIFVDMSYPGSTAGVATGVRANFGSVSLDNAGLVQVVAHTDEQAVGYFDAGFFNGTGAFFKNESTGVLTVWSAGVGIGVDFEQAGGFNDDGSFTNAGKISVSAAQATAVWNARTFVNSGTITATAINGGSDSIGVFVDGVPHATYQNSGLISANEAFVEGAGQAGVAFSITNTGTIIGDFVYDPSDHNNNTINNSGTIGGNIFFGDWNNTYSGASGVLHGAIFLGSGANTVTLGNDGEVAFASVIGGADTITGGAGDDFIEISRGENAIDGGGGFNTLSFANADAPVTVDLGAGTASAAGQDTIKNIQEVIGSGFADLLKAGATAATLVSGAGRSTLIGGAGDDTLIAGARGDSMTGGGGDNTFIYTAGDHQLVITDFDANGDKDVLKVFGYASAAPVQQGANTLITLSNGDSILLDNVQASSLTGGSIVYSAHPYLAPILPTGPAPLGATTITLDQPLTTGPHETIEADGSLGFGIAGAALPTLVNGALINFPSQIAVFGGPLDNGGVFHAVAQSGSLIGDLQQGGAGDGSVVFANEAGATFSVVAAVDAFGLFEGGLGLIADNNGRFTVTGGSSAYGVVSFDGETDLTNGAKGAIQVTAQADAWGVYLDNGGTFTNDGAMTIAGDGTVVGVESYNFAAEVVNAGTLKATSVGGQAYGVVIFSGGDLSNSGTITAQTAVYLNDGGYPVGSFTNTGVVNGDVAARGIQGTIQSTGAINGNLLQTDGALTIDLRGGSLSGYVSVTITDGINPAGDVIYLPTGSHLVKISHGAPESHATSSITVVGATGAANEVQFDIASGQATETHNPDGTWTVKAGVDGTETLTNVRTVQFTDRIVDLAAPNAFSGRGLSDFLMENTAGSVAFGEVKNGAAVYTTVAALGSEWKFHGNGDFLGDGKEGFLIENAAGAVDTGEVSGGKTTFTALAALGPEWGFKGVGDFLGKGHDEFLIENTAGAVVVGDQVSGHTVFTQVAGLGSEWSFRGAGDFLGDGKDQFLIENAAGAVVVGEVKNGAAAYTTVGALGSEWKFVGAGDFIGDGKDDFLIENTAGAVFAAEVVNGVAHYTQLTALGSEWKFVGAGDYLGEGHDQFLIENSAGAVAIGDWNGSALHFTTVASLGPEWLFH